jgi:NDP-sugar pyrophosphorylase family protein
VKKINDLFKIDNVLLKDFFLQYTYPFEILPNIHDFILELGDRLDSDYQKLKENVWVHKTATIGLGVEITGPAIIMDNVEVRHNAYLRENVIIGSGSVVGNSCEIKNSILISNCEVPHFNYVGDSILGDKARLGAGVILANLRLDKQNICIEKIDTKLRKIGAFIGDNVQIGCNSVICPGTVICPNAVIYPLSTVKGVIDEGKVFKEDVEVRKI